MKLTALAVLLFVLASACWTATPTPAPTPSAAPISSGTPASSSAPSPSDSALTSPHPSPTARPTGTQLAVTELPSPAADTPGRCAEADAVFDPDLQELLLVNCTTYQGGPKQLTVWGWNGEAWRVVTSGPAPARVVGGAALDAVRHVLTVYGGYVPDTDPCNSETWQWDGRDWSMASVVAPPACDHVKMIYDPIAELTLLVGGQDERNTGVDGTWTWDGRTWQQADTSLPPSRAHFGLQYDPQHQQVLLYGGLTTGAVLGDFWVRRAGQWEQLDRTAPGARSHVGMAYDTKADALYLYGGAMTTASFDSLTDDMWVLTSGAWRQLHPQTSPGARGSASMGYDPVRDRIVLYGGFDATGNELDDTWLWDGQNWSCVANCA